MFKPSQLLRFCLLLPALLVAMNTPAEDRLDEKTADHFASLALACVDREYPNLIHHVMAGDDEVG